MRPGAVILALALCVLMPVSASGSIAILLVGHRADRSVPNEKELGARIRELLDEVGAPSVKPVRYHFDRPQERQFCEQSLKIGQSDLVFAGVVELQGGVVRKVLYRHARADRNLEVSAQETVYQWRRLSGRLASPHSTECRYSARAGDCSDATSRPINTVRYTWPTSASSTASEWLSGWHGVASP